MEETEEEKVEEEEQPEEEAAKSDKSDKSDFVKAAERAAEDLKKANEEKAKLLEKEEKLQDRKEALVALGGGSPAGTKPKKPARLTDTEYAEALERGEVNPLKEDGFID